MSLKHRQHDEWYICIVRLGEFTMHVASKNGLQYLFVFFQHAFQIDALILKDLLRKYLPVIDRFMDVSISNVQGYNIQYNYNSSTNNRTQVISGVELHAKVVEGKKRCI